MECFLSCKALFSVEALKQFAGRNRYLEASWIASPAFSKSSPIPLIVLHPVNATAAKAMIRPRTIWLYFLFIVRIFI